MDYFTKTAEAGKPFHQAFLFDCHGHFGVDGGFHIPGASADRIVAGMDRLEGAIFLSLLGAYILIKPWFDKRQLFGKAEEA